MIKVAINGFGRIGRLAFREMITGTDFDIVAINDLTSAEDLAYLLKYDTNHGSFHKDVISFVDNYIVINNQKKIPVYQEKDPSLIPWASLGVDLVLECTGLFTKEEDARKHILAGAKKVLISAPGKGNMKTIVYGVNDSILDGTEEVVSAASCTTNCLAPVLKILDSHFGIMAGYMSTIHAYTNDQATLDVAHKKGFRSRRGRACAQNIVPSSTGAANAIGKVLPNLEGILEGVSYRVPVSDGSMIDLVLQFRESPSVEVINEVLQKNESIVLKTTNDPIVSSDVIGSTCASLVDLSLTSKIASNENQLFKVVAWYDNEMGYTVQMLRTAKKMFS